MTTALRLVMACCLLTACAGGTPGGFRDTDQQIGASTRFDTNAFAGDWRIVARFDAPQAGDIRFVPMSNGMEIISDARPDLNGAYREGSPGVLLPISEEQEAMVVMWVDADFETAAIGTASGSFGAVIDRDGVLPADRAAAARDILDFYGWDTAALQRTNA